MIFQKKHRPRAGATVYKREITAPSTNVKSPSTIGEHRLRVADHRLLPKSQSGVPGTLPGQLGPRETPVERLRPCRLLNNLHVPWGTCRQKRVSELLRKFLHAITWAICCESCSVKVRSSSLLRKCSSKGPEICCETFFATYFASARSQFHENFRSTGVLP